MEGRSDVEREAAQYAEGYRAGISALVLRGLVDEQHVGLIAFSRTGLAAIRLLADQPQLLAAIDISDASWWGYMLDLILTNMPLTSEQIRSLTGGAPTASTLPAWIQANPLYRIPESRAAVRLEASGLDSLLAVWEYYALLRNARRPVEFVYYPNGDHRLFAPLERLAHRAGAWIGFDSGFKATKTLIHRKWINTSCGVKCERVRLGASLLRLLRARQIRRPVSP